MVEFLREAVGVEGKELSEELALNSSELRLSEASLRPLLMELLSSQLEGQRQSQTPLPSPSSARQILPPVGFPCSRLPGHKPQFPVAPAAGSQQGAGTQWPRLAPAQPGTGLVPRQHTSPSDPVCPC